MKIRTRIRIKGLNQADVLAALFNGATAVDYFVAGGHPLAMDREMAQQHIEAHRSMLYFGKLSGRSLGISLIHGTWFDPAEYDRRNGEPGRAKRIIKHLRQTGKVTRPDGTSFATDEITEHQAS